MLTYFTCVVFLMLGQRLRRNKRIKICLYFIFWPSSDRI